MQPLVTFCVPEIALASILFLTLSVTPADVKRSFSKSTIIKYNLRSTQKQKRMSDLSILTIKINKTEKINAKKKIIKKSLRVES